ncbi:MAG: tRNA (adenosine(37)-N6)-threonylcarbamoyltransferase complex transferase subunit TsaD [Acidobacteria bacterium]|nr:tRNA (adenosine(37)-N6)-threonylcarbamoyltransferase complex transferase subunit TsaD [Acidobacteriota bacterium]
MATVLAIETSCDETAAAVVSETGDRERPWRVRSNTVASQAEIHREWGGVVPELASRQHIRDICGVVERALDDGCASWSELDAVAVTQGPGLVGSLLVGVAFAKGLAASLDLPLVPVHHLAGHIESLVVDNGRLPLPAVVLVVSGGHTNLYEVTGEGHPRHDCRLIGRTRDDAAGEAFDKVAALLGLTYPGGPVIDRVARGGDDTAVDFPVARMTHADRTAGATAAPVGIAAERRARWMEFSFSGLKTAVKRHVEARRAARGDADLADAEVADICASFQRAVVRALLDRVLTAARASSARSIGIAGGVSANSRLRADATAQAAAAGLPLALPTLALATDNAAMIGAAGLRLLRAGVRAPLDLNARASLEF